MTLGTLLRKHTTSAALIGVAFAMGAYAYFVDRGSITATERRDRASDVFPAYRREDVARVEISHPGGQTITLERHAVDSGGDGDWLLTSPRRVRADAAAVERLLGAFEFASLVRKVDPGNAKGLDAPRATGSLGMGRVVYRFALGSPAPTPEGAAYLRVDGEGTSVVDRELVNALLQDDGAYRDRTIVPYLSLDLSRFDLSGKGESWVLERMDGTSFRFADVQLRASREKLDRVWKALAEMRAEAFVDDAVAERAIADPAFTLRMTPKDGRPAAVLVVGSACPDHPEDVVVVRREPDFASACVPKGVLEGLGTSRDELIDRRLFAAHADEIEEIVLQGLGPEARRVEIARKGKGWHERAPRDRELAGDEVDAADVLAETLAHAEGESVRREDSTFSERATVTVRGNGDREETVRLSPADASGASVRRNADGATLRVSAALTRKLLPSEIAIRSRTLFDPPLPEGKLPSHLSVRCDGVTQDLTRDEHGWSLREPKGFPVDSAGAVDLWNAVSQAKAIAWVADGDDGTFGLSPSACTVRFDVDLDAGTVVAVDFGREGEGGTYARLEGNGPVFVAAKPLRESVGKWLIDRGRFRVDPLGVERVVVQKGGRRLVWVRHGDQLAAADGGGTELGEKIGDALGNMRADRVVHLGPPRSDEGFSPPALEVTVTSGADSSAPVVHFVVGHSAVLDNVPLYFARVDGVDATFAIAQGRLAALFDAM